MYMPAPAECCFGESGYSRRKRPGSPENRAFPGFREDRHIPVATPNRSY